MNFSDNEKYAVLAILSLIMEADTIIHPKEVEFMDEMMRRLSISVHDLDHIEVNDLNLLKTAIMAMPLHKQEAAKEWFHAMAEVDGNVDPREIEIINKIFIA